MIRIFVPAIRDHRRPVFLGDLAHHQPAFLLHVSSANLNVIRVVPQRLRLDEVEATFLLNAATLGFVDSNSMAIL